MSLLITLLYALVFFYYWFIYLKGRRLLNPGALFALSQLVMFAGTLNLLDETNSADQLHLYVMLLGLFFFVSGNLSAQSILPVSRTKVRNWWSSATKVEDNVAFNLKFYGLIALCVAISAAYYYFVGHIFFLSALTALIRGEGVLDDAAGMRLEAYAGERYLAPGYVNQFKNMILPLLTGFAGARYILLKKRSDLCLTLLISPLSLIFLIGTGQRGALFIMICIISIFFWAILPRKSSRRTNFILILGATIVFFSLTAILGRSSPDSSPLTSLTGRLLYDNQLSSVIAFRYLYDLPTCWGSEWSERILGLLPGNRGSSLDNDIFSLMFVSRRGTSPPSVWGSIWYNFGIMGVIGVGFILGACCHLIYLRLFRKPKTMLRVLTYAALSAILGFWVAGGPDALANLGIGAVCALKIILSLKPSRKSQSVAVPVSAAQG
jgi:oligosaccharide repeat unit polymerase